ncbi:MAG TPA: Mur ligase domain-containing protein, partial [Rhodocyclaceae bacterium]|nr:Mur ligase domain-containing protein [Rhodocyclaceae bacterium]
MTSRVPEILAELRSRGVAVYSLASDSRAVEPGDVFLAYPGELSDGRAYIGAALERGAAAVVYEARGTAGEVAAELAT